MCTYFITPIATWLYDTPLVILTLKFHDLHPFLIYTPTPSVYAHPIFNCALIPHSYQFPEICAFITGFSFTVRTKKSSKKVRKQVRGCLQNLYQSVAIHLKYALLVLL